MWLVRSGQESSRSMPSARQCTELGAFCPETLKNCGSLDQVGDADQALSQGHAEHESCHQWLQVEVTGFVLFIEVRLAQVLSEALHSCWNGNVPLC